ncbi:type II secretion system F family protein [Konateibacter massiliensis]|uniref:type II secretion system F family protein n=1 Tax=Konateibacter massiliensis TaxID=2002841 RepID=UPI000C15F20D|nr:type II secretion system F family protein [Konateibacter massiliensis]
MIDYSKYKFTKAEALFYGGEWLGLCGVVGWLFYHSVIAVMILFLFLNFFYEDKKRGLLEKRKKELNLQFKDAINSLSGALAAGYSVENAFAEVYEELCLVYTKDALIMKELYHIMRRLEMNETIEVLLLDLANRSGDEDIKSFVEVFTIAKRSGGDFTAIIDMTANSITGKIEVKREIDVLLASKKLEQKIMNMIPMLIILYIGITSKGYFNILYKNVFGIIVMTICLGVYLFAYFMGRRIVDVEV